jgi:hypothetical protein
MILFWRTLLLYPLFVSLLSFSFFCLFLFLPKFDYFFLLLSLTLTVIQLFGTRDFFYSALCLAKLKAIGAVVSTDLPIDVLLILSDESLAAVEAPFFKCSSNWFVLSDWEHRLSVYGKNKILTSSSYKPTLLKRLHDNNLGGFSEYESQIISNQF